MLWVLFAIYNRIVLNMSHIFYVCLYTVQCTPYHVYTIIMSNDTRKSNAPCGLIKVVICVCDFLIGW